MIVALTGATGEIGGAIATGISQHKHVSTLVLLVRDATRGEQIASKLRSSTLSVEVALADLAKPASIVACAKVLREKFGRIDVLVNNAATVPTTRHEVDGIETQFAVNVLSYFVLMRALLPSMPTGGRVVCVASNLAGGLDLDDLQSAKRPYNARATYSMTKQANRMIAAEAAAAGRGFREAGVSVTSCHPGVVTSTLLQNLGFGSGFDTAVQGAALPLKLALGPTEPTSGTFWSGGASGKVCEFGRDLPRRTALWEACEQLAAARGAATGGGA